MDRAGGEIPRVDPEELLAEPLRRAVPVLMRRAIEVAKLADRPFACILADLSTGAVIHEAPNTGERDATNHAEMNALRALPALKVDPAHLALVTTAEPCPMCATACWWAGIGVVIYGTSIASLIRLGWKQIDVSAAEIFSRARPSSRVILIGGVLEEETDKLYVSGPVRPSRGIGSLWA